MAGAASRFTGAIDFISRDEHGVTAAELAAAMRMSAQASRRLLESMVTAGLAERDEDSRRYFLTLAFYHWGFSAAARYSPAPFIQQEMAALSERTQKPVYHLLRDRSWIVGMERVAWEGSQCYTSPFLRRYHWSESAIGLTLVAYLPVTEIDQLTASEKASKETAAKLREELEDIRQRGFAERDAVDPHHYLAIAPILDNAGYATAVLVLSSTDQPSADERRRLVAALLETCARSSPSRRVANILDSLD